MQTLTKPMKRLIENFSAGAVATINEDGTPAVSPKATFVVVDDQCIAFGNIRSPGTVANILVRPDLEVSFLDVLTRRAVRIKGRAEIVTKDSEAGQRLMPAFEAQWATYLGVMQNFVSIHVTRAELILSPAYDLGHTAEELRRVNLDKLCKL
jgi:predicted pyridoxine 5'-phosphate oxidase superfamily flavin-nucleotide-binding protein